MIDALAQAVIQAAAVIAVRLLVALLRDVLMLTAMVWLVIAVGRVPLIRRTPYLGRFAADCEAGARRMFVEPAQRALRNGIAPRNLGWCLILVVVVVAAVPTLARVPAVLALTWAVGHSWSGRVPGWWSHRTLVGAMVTAGVLPKPREGDPPPSVSYRGTPRHTEHGTTVVVGLPGGRTLSDALGKRESLAAALHVPAARLEITQHEDDPANVIRIHVSHGTSTETPATVTNLTATDWATPVRIGRDSRGEPVHLATNEHNTLVAGRPGSGKTSLSRILLGHYLLDPCSQVHLLDGKGSTTDYGAARNLCTRFVSGTDEDAVPATLAMLREVLTVVRERNATGGSHPGVLLLLEEFQDVRAAADRTQRDQLDNTLGRIVRMGRAVAVHVLISTQRPTVDDLPAGTRNLLSQRVALMLRNGSDAALVLGATPSLALPTRRGQALYTDGGTVSGVLLDRLTDQAWSALCAAATALRGPHTPAPSLTPTETLPGPHTAASPALVDPLLGEVLRVLADGDPTGLPATQIHALLPGWARTGIPTAHALGLALGRRNEGLVERVSRGPARVWRATAHGQAVARKLSPTPRQPVGEPSQDSLGALLPRSTGPADSREPPLPTTTDPAYAPTLAATPAPAKEPRNA